MHDSANAGVIEQTAKEGFAVGNHTWDHLNLKKEEDVNIIEKEINKDSELINKLTGSFPRFFRAPYGESNTYIRKLAKDKGMIFMDWSGAAKDWEKSTIEKDIFINNVTNNLHSGSIILIHEHPWSLANLDALLTTLESDGYTYVDPKNIIE
jgi:peptidoglycan/xylan/chitin deacetylase (PgdA/CDA1 family)